MMGSDGPRESNPPKALAFVFRIAEAPRCVRSLLVSGTDGRHETGHTVRLADHHHHRIWSVHEDSNGVTVVFSALASFFLSFLVCLMSDKICFDPL